MWERLRSCRFQISRGCGMEKVRKSVHFTNNINFVFFMALALDLLLYFEDTGLFILSIWNLFRVNQYAHYSEISSNETCCQLRMLAENKDVKKCTYNKIKCHWLRSVFTLYSWDDKIPVECFIPLMLLYCWILCH